MVSPDSPLHRTGEERAVLAVTGKDRLSWLNGLVTCDLSKSAPEHYGLILEKKGKIVTDFYWLSGPNDTLYVLVPAALADDVVKLLDHHLIMEDAEIARVDLVPHWIYGVGTDFEAPEGKVGTKILLRGVGGTEAVPAAVILEPGAPKDGTLTPEGWEALRQEHAIPLFGVDFDTTIYPQEAAIEGWAVSFEKGCYLGQEVVYMQKHRGQARRRLVSLRLEGDVLPERGARVLDQAGADVGEITSASLAAGAIRAIALVKTAAGKEGASVSVASTRGAIV